MRPPCNRRSASPRRPSSPGSSCARTCSTIRSRDKFSPRSAPASPVSPCRSSGRSDDRRKPCATDVVSSSLVSLPGRFLDTAAGRVYVHRAGKANGPKLVLLHGYMMSHWYFHGLYPALGQTHDVLAVDLPGYGESDRPSTRSFAYDYPAFAGVVVEVLDQLGLDRVRLLGHSMGGGVALTIAARWPERVERLVLECPAIYPLPMPVESKLILNKLVGRFLFHNGISRWEIKRQMLK